jgi:hypothetical protein
MAASLDRSASPARRWRRWLMILAAIPIVLSGLSWWLTEPLEDEGAKTPPPVSTISLKPVVPLEVARPADVPPPWPEERVDGKVAKTVLLETLLAVRERLEKVEGYTASFRKQERVNGTLLPLQTLSIKVRRKPFAIYLKFLAPKEGREVVYAEGHHENKVIAHSGGVARFLVPRLAVPPNHPLALAESRHPVTEAGLLNLTNKLIVYRELDMDDTEAVTILDRVTDDDGRVWLRSVHTHPSRHSNRPFARVDVRYDPETRIPVDIESYDWPEPGHQGDLFLAEHYSYDNLNLGADLTTLDFDPANPAYTFHRY